MDKQNLNLNPKKRRCDEKEIMPVRPLVDDREDDQDEEIMLPGFRFHPTDEELLTFYLRRKVDRKRLSIEVIKEVDIYRFDPWELPRTSGGGENEWYYFCLRGRKYRNSSRPNRVTNSGFWKATGIDRPIYASTEGTAAGMTQEGAFIGLKKSLVYYRGSAGKGTKTDWMMHEYRLPVDLGNEDGVTPPSMQEAEVWTICRIFKRGTKYKRDPRNSREVTSNKNQTDQYSSSNTSSLEFDGGGDPYQIDNGDASNNNYVNNSQYNCFDDRTDQMNQGRWMNHPTVQNPAPVFHPNDLNSVGNWDELGIMMEYINQSLFQDYV